MRSAGGSRRALGSFRAYYADGEGLGEGEGDGDGLGDGDADGLALGLGDCLTGAGWVSSCGGGGAAKVAKRIIASTIAPTRAGTPSRVAQSYVGHAPVSCGEWR